MQFIISALQNVLVVSNGISSGSIGHVSANQLMSRYSLKEVQLALRTLNQDLNFAQHQNKNAYGGVEVKLHTSLNSNHKWLFLSKYLLERKLSGPLKGSRCNRKAKNKVCENIRIKLWRSRTVPVILRETKLCRPKGRQGARQVAEPEWGELTGIVTRCTVCAPHQT